MSWALPDICFTRHDRLVLSDLFLELRQENWLPRVACFKMTMSPPNIMTFWHNMLYDITGWMQKKIELMNRNWQVDNFSKFIKGKHGFYKGGKTEKFEIPFLARIIYQYWSRVYQKMQNSKIWGGMFPTKSWFCQYFHEIIMTLDFWSYNGAPL